MSRGTVTALVVGAIVLIAAAGAGGYHVGRSGAPSDAEARRAHDSARTAALRDADRVEREQLDEAREAGVALGRRRGEKHGAADGRAAGESEAATNGAGPTPVPPPKLPSDLYTSGGAGYTQRPGTIIVGNHSVIEGIVWQSWGAETATGTGELVGVECDPSCAEGPETRDSVTLRASDPSFNPENVRHYSKLRVEGGPEPFTIDVPPYY